MVVDILGLKFAILFLFSVLFFISVFLSLPSCGLFEYLKICFFMFLSVSLYTVFLEVALGLHYLYITFHSLLMLSFYQFKGSVETLPSVSCIRP